MTISRETAPPVSARRLLPLLFAAVLLLAACPEGEESPPRKKDVAPPEVQEPVVQAGAVPVPTRELIVFQSPGGGIWARYPTGGPPTYLSEGASPQFTADGREIVHECGWDICVMDASGSNRRPLVEEIHLPDNNYVLSEPTMRFDRQRVVFVRRSVETEERDLRVFNLQTNQTGDLVLRQPVESPDYATTSRAVVFAARGAEVDDPRTEPWRPRDLWMFDQSGQLVRVTNTPRIDEASPEFSPDDREIVFSRRDGNLFGAAEIYVMNVANGTLRRLTNDRLDDLDPTWSPDGSRIAYSSEEEVANSERGRATFTIRAMSSQNGSNDVEVVGLPRPGDPPHYPTGAINPTWAVTPPTIAVQDNRANEHDGLMPLRVTLSASQTSPVSVDYEIQRGWRDIDDYEDGYATEGVDYRLDVPNRGTLTFAPGETTKTITVRIIEDQVDENLDESFHIDLANARGAGLLDPLGRVDIRDNDREPQILLSDASVLEGQRALVRVSLSQPSGRDLFVSYETVEGSAKAGTDFETTSGEFTFSPGETSKVIEIPTIIDPASEQDETLTLSFYSNYRAELPRPTATVTITEIGPVLSLEGGRGREGSSGVVNFTVRLSRASSTPVTALFNTDGGSATEGGDFIGQNDRPIFFEPGQTAVTIPVAIRDDQTTEGTESFIGTLSQVSGATLAPGRGSATGTIDDDDASGGGGGGGGDPEGRIAVIRSSGGFDLGDIVLLENDGSDEIVLTVGESWSAPDWKHDLTEIASTEFGPDSYDTFAIDPDTGAHENITEDPETNDEHDATWSPDGTMIAFTSFTGPGGAGEIFVWTIGEPLDADNPKQITDDGDNHRHPAWAPDSLQLAWDTYDGTEYVISSAFDVTDSAPIIGMITPPGDDCNELHPAFAPGDEGDYAWTQSGPGCDGDGGTDYEIAAFNDPSVLTVLTENDEDDLRPTWSPDGTQMAFQSDRDGGDFDIFRMDAFEGEADEAALQLTSNDVDDVAPDWEPM